MFQRKFYIAAALIVLMAIGFLAASVSSYFIATRSLSSQISEQSLPLTSDNIYSEIQRDMLRPVVISSLMASDTFLKDWALNGEVDEFRVRNYLTEIQETFDTITAYFISGQSLNYYHPSGIIKQVSTDDPEDEWFFRARDMSEPYEINIDEDTADLNRISIFVNYRVLDYYGDFIGVTGVGLSMELASGLIDDYQERYGSTIYFTDREGRITLSGSRQHVSELSLQERLGTTLATQVLSVPSSRLEYQQNGNTYYLNTRMVPEFNWYLVVEQQSGAASLQIQNALWVNIALALSILVLVLVAGYFTLRTYQGRLEEMASTDSLTGLFNRHMFEVIFNQVTKSMSRIPREVTLLTFDIDHFKKVNDTYGHPGGDEVLQTVANTLAANIRESDTLCRWGGEEFLLLLDNCPAQEGVNQARKLCDVIRRLYIPFGKDTLRITLSCGVAERRPGEVLTSLVNRADAALYRAKENGRDQVCKAD